MCESLVIVCCCSPKSLHVSFCALPVYCLQLNVRQAFSNLFIREISILIRVKLESSILFNILVFVSPLLLHGLSGTHLLCFTQWRSDLLTVLLIVVAWFTGLATLKDMLYFVSMKNTYCCSKLWSIILCVNWWFAALLWS